MLPRQQCCPAAHSVQVKVLRHGRHVPPLKNPRLLRIPDTVAVGLCPGIQAGMEPGLHVHTGIYADILRKILPQFGQNLLRRHGAFAVEIRHLPQRVYPGIGAAAAADLDRFLQNPGKGRFQLALDGVVPSGQALPAPVAGAVVANIKPQIPHNPPSLPWPPARYPPRTGTCRFCHTPERVHPHNASET